MVQLPPRSGLAALCAPDAFVWATGIEDTVISTPWPGTGRVLDEYALTGHDRQWRRDFALLAGLGVGAVRYGIPWERVQPTPGTWDWEWADRRLERLLELGIDPIIDLLHYGVPRWIEGAFLAPEFPRRLADFARRFAERYRGRIRWYTPVNEPRVTAWYSGRLGWWPPNRRGWRGFTAVLLALARATCATVAALREVDPEIVDVHVDATDVYSSPDPALSAEVALRTRLVFLPLDLVTGRVGARHPLRGWLNRNGAGDEDLEWLAANALAAPAVIGINLYPLFSGKELSRPGGGLRTANRYAPPAIVERIATAYFRRYRRPVMITETASAGSVARRLAWLRGSVAAVRRLRSHGVPVVGYTWWPLFAMVTWAYRQGSLPPSAYLAQMGLWDIPASEELPRVRTPLAGAYSDLATGGAAAVGRLRASTTMVRRWTGGAAHVP